MYNIKSAATRLKPHFLPLAILCIITIAVYAPSLRHEFLTNWDDERYITGNAAARGISLSHLAAAFSRYYVGNYAPLQIISYMLDYEIWGLRASGFILTNILLHLANGLLFYRLLVMLAFSKLAAFLASYIFLMHPVQVESVNWISQRKNVLAMSLFLAAFIYYVNFTRSAPDKKGRGRSYMASLAAFACALLAKAVVVVLPFALILFDYCYAPRCDVKKRLINKIPYIMLAMLVGAITILAQLPDGDLHVGITSFHGGGPIPTLLTMLPVMMLYVRHLILPYNLCAIYVPEIKQAADLQVVAASGGVLVLILAGILLFKQRKDLGFWYIFFFLCLVPVSQIIPLVTLMNDRYLYFPLLGAAALVGYGLARLCVWPPCKLSKRKLSPACLLLIFPLVLLPALSLKRAQVWQNSVTLWTDAVHKTPNPDTMFGLANAYHLDKNLETAKKLYYEVLIKYPRHHFSLYNLAQLLMEQGDFVAARELLLILTDAHPEFARGFESLGDNYYVTGDEINAEQFYRRALETNPNLFHSMLVLGRIQLSSRNLLEAERNLTHAFRLDAENPELLYVLACLWSVKGNTADALNYLDAALKLGYRDKVNVLENPELKNIRRVPEFDALVRRYLPTY